MDSIKAMVKSFLSEYPLKNIFSQNYDWFLDHFLLLLQHNPLHVSLPFIFNQLFDDWINLEGYASLPDPGHPIICYFRNFVNYTHAIKDGINYDQTISIIVSEGISPRRFIITLHPKFLPIISEPGSSIFRVGRQINLISTDFDIVSGNANIMKWPPAFIINLEPYPYDYSFIQKYSKESLSLIKPNIPLSFTARIMKNENNEFFLKDDTISEPIKCDINSDYQKLLHDGDVILIINCYYFQNLISFNDDTIVFRILPSDLPQNSRDFSASGIINDLKYDENSVDFIVHSGNSNIYITYSPLTSSLKDIRIGHWVSFFHLNVITQDSELNKIVANSTIKSTFYNLNRLKSLLNPNFKIFSIYSTKKVFKNLKIQTHFILRATIVNIIINQVQIHSRCKSLINNEKCCICGTPIDEDCIDDLLIEAFLEDGFYIEPIHAFFLASSLPISSELFEKSNEKKINQIVQKIKGQNYLFLISLLPSSRNEFGVTDNCVFRIDLFLPIQEYLQPIIFDLKDEFETQEKNIT